MRRVVDVKDFDIPSDENDYDELVAFADTMASVEQFDAYTKDEVIAMLEDLKKEIENKCIIPNNTYDWNNGVYACCRVVQSKIDKLKGEH